MAYDLQLEKHWSTAYQWINEQIYNIIDETMQKIKL